MVSVSKGKSRSDNVPVLCWTPPISASLIVAHALCGAIAVIMVQAARGFSTRETALAFYGVYHREPMNQVIHFFGVPGIILSLLVFEFHVGPLFFLVPFHKLVMRLPFIPPHSINWATLYALFYLAFYYSVDRWGAVLYSPVVYGMYAVAAHWTHEDRTAAEADAYSTSTAKGSSSNSRTWLGTGRALRLAGYMHVGCWYTQIHWGHKMVEGAQPAVVQSLGGALTTAPLFAFYEGVWALGFQRELQREVKVLVDQYTRELCGQGVSMRACDALN
jgi:2-hydroxy fatty acid dioxygenase